MKTFASALAACLVGLLMTAALAYATAGTPISGVPIGLEHDPEGIVTRGVTDGKGNVTFTNLKPGAYAIVVTNASRLPAFVFRITNVRANAVAQVSEPVLPGKSDKAYALDKNGRKLMVEDSKDGQITVTVETAK